MSVPRRASKRLSTSKSTPLYNESLRFSSDEYEFVDETEEKVRRPYRHADRSANTSYDAVVSTPIRSRLSRGRAPPKRMKTEEEESGAEDLKPSTQTPRRLSRRLSIKPEPFQHFPYEVPKTKRESTALNRSVLVKTELSPCSESEEPKRESRSKVAHSPRKSHLLKQLEDSPGYVSESLSPSSSFSGIRRSGRDPKPNKKYTVEPTGATSLRITSTPRARRPSAVRNSTISSGSSSTSTVVSPPASVSKSRKYVKDAVQTPQTRGRKSSGVKATPVSTGRGRGRPKKSASPVKPVRKSFRSASKKLSKTTHDEEEGSQSENDNDQDYNNSEDERASGGMDTESELESDSEEEESVDDGDSDSSYGGSKSRRKSVSRNLSRRFEDMDFENALTPSSEALKLLSAKHTDTTTPLRLLQASQYNEQNSPNPESYFLAKPRLKFLPEKKVKDVIANDSRKGKGKVAKKPRKGTRGTGGEKIVNLPTRPKLNFSVTKEANRVAASKLVVPVAENSHEKEIDTIMRENIIPDFPRWIYYMREGFNIMLHGFGSKIPVFQEFKAHLNGEWLVITVNGLYPKLNPRKFLVDLCESLEVEEKIRIVGTNMDVLAEEVYAQLKDIVHPRVFLLVRNFDTLAIRHPAFLTALSSMARVKWIHILASSDTINAFLGVNQNQTIQLNFCWIPCSTFQPYEEELTWLPGAFGEEVNGGGAKSTLQYVLKSLTGNARKAFSILASLQLAKMGGARGKRSKEFLGVEFRDLARRCRERFIAHSDSALKTLLIEFVDHKLISHSGKSKNVGNLLTIELDKETLQELASAGV